MIRLFRSFYYWLRHKIRPRYVGQPDILVRHNDSLHVFVSNAEPMPNGEYSVKHLGGDEWEFTNETGSYRMTQQDCERPWEATWKAEAK